jgi:2-haloacid dehalogenase
VFDGFGESLGFESSAAERAAFAGSVGAWPPFPDTVPSLRAMAERYRLAVVSNVDDDLFAGSAARLGVRFDEVVTAEQVGSYKPSPAHFHEVLERLGVPRERVLHVAQSLYHDIAPAGELGIRSVWVNRRAGQEGSGATAPSEARPDLEVLDLRTLVGLMGLA